MTFVECMICSNQVDVETTKIVGKKPMDKWEKYHVCPPCYSHIERAIEHRDWNKWYD